MKRWGRFLLSLPRGLTLQIHAPDEHTEQAPFLSKWAAGFVPQVTESHQICVLESQEREAVGAVQHQEVIVASHCKSRNEGHKIACQRNLAILAPAHPANSLPATAAILDWHRSYMIAKLCCWPYDSSLAWECSWAACKLHILKRQLLTTCIQKYETHNVGATSTATK